MDHPDERRVEGERVLEHEGEQDVVLSLPLLQLGQVGSQRRVSVHAADLDIPLVQGVVNKFNLFDDQILYFATDAKDMNLKFFT